MFSKWSNKEQEGYELMDGSSHNTGSDGCSTPSSPTLSYTHTPTDEYPAFFRTKASSSSSSSSSSFGAHLSSVIRRHRRKVILLCIGILAWFIMQSILSVILSPPAYVVLKPENYLEALEATMRDRIPLQSKHARQEIASNLADLRSGSTFTSSATIPNMIYSSDKSEPALDWAAMWKEMGFEAKFYNDEEANGWVLKEFNGTEIIDAWKEMPRMILRADMLRYLLLLVYGGTWSDMDVVPVRPFSNWSSEAVPFPYKDNEDRLRKSSTYSAAAAVRHFKENTKSVRTVSATAPVRGIVGIDGVPNWLTVPGLLERLNLLPLHRHRNLQFVQWTIHMVPYHPILVDVLRRILETREIYRAYKVEIDKETQRTGWGWEEGKGESTPHSLLQESSSLSVLSDKGSTMSRVGYSAPWESIGRQWIYTQGRWRLGWHSTSVEEWTGPGVWTDAVVSYINAISGIRPEQMAKITEPIQIGDLIVLPEYGYNPPRNSASNPWSVSRVVHLFRGSWKDTVITNTQSS